ncbi:MAG: hypothetical protein LBM98_07050 [Oscillospiraceae bacterium]|nr:hypothetical protein [Oscillospiraceae bacterium]
MGRRTWDVGRGTWGRTGDTGLGLLRAARNDGQGNALPCAGTAHPAHGAGEGGFETRPYVTRRTFRPKPPSLIFDI